MPFTNIAKIIGQKFKDGPMARNVTAALTCEEFNKLIIELWGKKMENMARAVYLKDKVLNIACLSSVVAQEIKMREAELLKKIGQRLGHGVVEKLRFLS